jgi:hypothetical protein
MDNLPQLGLAAVTVLCAVLCVVAILLAGGVVLLFRSGLIQRVLGLDSLAERPSKSEDDRATEAQIRSFRTQQSSATNRAEDIRARYDRQFDSQVGGQSAPRSQVVTSDETAVGPADDWNDDDPGDDKARFKRRFREENPDWDDELDSFLDNREL